jgi:hypothetical protein
MGMGNLSGLFLGLGIVVGVTITFLFIYGLGRSFVRRLDLESRGAWERPLAAPIPKDTVVAVYKRRKWYHRHDRHHYEHRRPAGH